MSSTVCGTVSRIEGNQVAVTVNRKAACDGCHAVEACHSFSRKTMAFTFPMPAEPVQEGDRVIIAIEENAFLIACIYAFGIPLFVLLATIGILAMLGLGSALQAVLGLGAMAVSLIVVRFLGKDVRGPRIIEIIHNEV